MPSQTPDESAPEADPIEPSAPSTNPSAQELLAQVRADLAKNLHRDVAPTPRPTPSPSPQLQEIQARLAQLRAQQAVPGLTLPPRAPVVPGARAVPPSSPRSRVLPTRPGVPEMSPVDRPALSKPALADAPVEAAAPEPADEDLAAVVAAPALPEPSVVEAATESAPLIPARPSRRTRRTAVPVDAGAPRPRSATPVEAAPETVPELASTEDLAEPAGGVGPAAPQGELPEPAPTVVAGEPVEAEAGPGGASMDVAVAPVADGTTDRAARVRWPWVVLVGVVVVALLVVTALVLRDRGVLPGSCRGATTPALADDGSSAPPVPVTGLIGDRSVGCFLTPSGEWYGASLPVATVGGGVMISDATVPVQATSRASLVLQPNPGTDQSAAQATATADIAAQATLTVSDQGATRIGPARGPAYCYTGDFASTGLPAVRACYVVTADGVAVLTVRATTHDSPMFAVFDSYRPA